MAKGMASGPGSFRTAVLAGWIVLGAAGIGYARLKGVSGAAAWSMIAAFLVAYPFYLVPAFPSMRERLAGNRLPVYMVVSAALPYLVSCLGAVQFHWFGLARMIALALAFALWYRVLPPLGIVDAAFLVLIPVVLLGHYFDAVFTTSDPSWARYAVVLGHVTLIQLVVITLLLERHAGEFGYGFVPTWNEWRTGLLHYAYFALIGFPLAFALKAVQVASPAPIWKIAGVFLGFLWVIALSEEFLFRGILLHWMEEWTWSERRAVIATSLLYGVIHLWFRGFPNWRWAAITAVLGWLCARARIQAGGIRAGVVTHALVVTTWQAFFR